MTKTPEQMAEEYAEFGLQGVPDSIRKQQIMAKDRMAFLAGYQAAKNQLADADKVMDFNKGNFAKMEKVNMKFAYDSFPVTDKQAQDVKQIRENFSLLSDVLTQLVPNGRYLSIVQTKLEEACMFAVKGITHQAGDYGNLQNKA
jgi:hypothetical protein